MSMEVTSRARGRWRPLEQLGLGAGRVAGCAALGLLWTYALSMDLRDALTAVKAKTPSISRLGGA